MHNLRAYLPRGSGDHDALVPKTRWHADRFGGFGRTRRVRVGFPRAADDAAGVAFFENKIRPVLVERCYECHSSQSKKLRGGLRLDTREGIRAGGETGPAIVPSNLDESLLFQAISAVQGIEPMPPKGKLSGNVVADFRQWIKMGAPDPRDGKTAAELSAAQTGRSYWWALQPLKRPAVPRIPASAAGWPGNPIDAFVLAKLGEKGLAHSPEANRRTLIRRLSFDLVGLPPEPEEVEAFENDRSALAYERLVDRLLGSPHYGERWARYWMDLVHFAETHGHDQDRIRPNAWPYRDYLIRSFNRDTPYSRFVAEQVAADALFPDEPELAVALGMLAAGPWDESSLRDIRDDSIDRQIGHYIDRDDMVSTVMSTFVSSTVHCARVPRPQVRPDLAGRLLQPAGRFRRGGQGRARIRRRSGGGPAARDRFGRA